MLARPRAGVQYDCHYLLLVFFTTAIIIVVIVILAVIIDSIGVIVVVTVFVGAGVGLVLIGRIRRVRALNRGVSG